MSGIFQSFVDLPSSSLTPRSQGASHTLAYPLLNPIQAQLSSLKCSLNYSHEGSRMIVTRAQRTGVPPQSTVVRQHPAYARCGHPDPVPRDPEPQGSGSLTIKPEIILQKITTATDRASNAPKLIQKTKRAVHTEYRVSP
jgi:hypothetical protein